MIYGVVLAGGVGSRMGNVGKPKQYLLVGDKPILIHTLEKFYMQSEFEKVLVLCPTEWISHTKNLVRKYMKDTERIVVLEGGETRNETIMNSIAYIEKEGNLNEDTIIVTHDSVRPFVTQRILEENIRYAKEYGACDTAVAATDTIVCSEDNVVISDIPERRKMYQGQTPQSFKIKKLKSLYEGLSEEEKTLYEQIEQYKKEQEDLENQIQAAINWSGALAIQYKGGVMLWPIAVDGTYITSPYGNRLHPIQGVYRYHDGIDIGNAGYGAPVIAAADGIVTYAGVMSGYGNCVMINHGDGIVTLYGHGQEIYTELGATVKQGDVIMAVGSTGNSTGPHLHFEVRKFGVAVDPIPYLQGDGLQDENNNTIANVIGNTENVT